MFNLIEDVLLPIFVIGSIFVAAPWIILHYVTRWKTQATLTREDEQLLDDLYELGRRLEERITTIERILSADNPGWRNLAADRSSIDIEDEVPTRRQVK